MYKKIATLSFAGLLFCSLAARASTISFTDSTPGTTCCFNVDVTQISSTDIKLTVNLIDGAESFVHSGNGTNHPGFGFNLTSGFNAISISFPAGSIWTGETLGMNAVTNGPAVGTFEYFFNNPGTGSGDAGPLVFDILSSSSAISYMNLVQNSAGNYFAADIQNSAGLTGEAAVDGNPTMSTTPEPSSMLLLGTGLVSAAGMLRRRFVASSNRS